MVNAHPTSLLITGASSGLGAALAIAYAHDDCNMALLGRDKQRLHEVANSCRARGAHVQEAYIDVRDKEGMREFITAYDAMHPLQLLVANAGVSAGTLGGNETEEQARLIFDVNVNGVLNTVQPIIPRFKQRGAGQIAIISSLASIVPLPQAPSYSASKAAVRYYAEGLHGLLKPYGVRVCAVCPGYIDTPMTRVNGFYMPALMSANHAAARIICGLRGNKSRFAFPRRLAWPLHVLNFLPARVVSALMHKLPEKPQFS